MNNLNQALILLEKAQQLISTQQCETNQQLVVRYGIGRDLSAVVERTDKFRALFATEATAPATPNAQD